jgi:SOS-response transcriptional repressor LexA
MKGLPIDVRKRQLVEAIDRTGQARGFAPTQRELAQELGLSLARVAQLVAACEADGLISRKAMSARTCRVISTLPSAI